MKKLFCLVLALSMCLSLVACGGGSSSGNGGGGAASSGAASSGAASSGGSSASTPSGSQGGSTSTPSGGSGDTIKIGVFEPLTGDSASGGNKEFLGMQYARSITPTVEVGGVTYNVELVTADNGSTTDKAPSAAADLVGKGVSLVLGSYGSGVSMAGGPIFNDAGLSAIGVSCTNPNVTAGNDYYYRICFLDDFQAHALANYVQGELGAKTAYCLGELGNEYDQGLIAFFTQYFEAAGGKVVSASFPTNNSDFTTYLNQAKSEGADVIFIPNSISYITQILTQADSLGIEIPFLGSDTADDNMVLSAVAGTNVKLYLTTFYEEGGDPDFDEGFKAFLNSDPTLMSSNGGNDIIAAVSAMGYDAYNVAIEAIKAAGSTDPAAIKAAIGGVSVDGVSGSISFEPVNGDAVRDFAFIKTADTAAGQWSLVGKTTVE